MPQPAHTSLATFALRQRLWLGLALLAIWLSGMVMAFWWFQYRNVQPFDRQAVFFDGRTLGAQLHQLLDQIAQRDVKRVATVVHFYNPDCPCNKFNEAHVRELMTHYGNQGVRFVVVVNPASSLGQQQAMARAKQIFNHPAVIGFRQIRDIHPPSSPAVAILDAQGQLAYFGPYSVGAVCTVQNGGFVETALDKLFQGKNSKQLNTLAVGCFCPWPATTQHV